MSALICSPPQTNCFSCVCNACLGPTDLENTLEAIFTDGAVANITFRQWVWTDRRGLITTVKSTEDFIESLLEKLLLRLHHSFTSTQQNMFLRELKYRVLSFGI
jgi:hypothetical protein